ncbi:hypothetical protein GGH96_005803 [Coemansia sp. RSA 1972]|nr:hypothetical protein GGH96_005803 [Coemansia sp. RSA 1972]
MATNLDQSLDDIIKSTPRSSGSGGRGRRDGNSRGQTRNSPYARRSGGVQKNDSSRKPSQQQQQQAAQMMMLNNPAYLAALQQQHRQKQGSGSSGKILINNLDYGVTEADLRELFQQVGALSKVALNFNRRGTSNGSGMVVFKNPAHAQSAFNRYNNVELDHRKMLIEVVGGGAAPGVVPMVVPMMPQTFAQPQNAQSGGRRNRRGNGPSSGNAQSGKSQGSSAQGSNGNAQGGRRRGGRQDKPQPSAEQLDADLDEYMKDANNAS